MRARTTACVHKLMVSRALHGRWVGFERVISVLFLSPRNALRRAVSDEILRNFNAVDCSKTQKSSTNSGISDLPRSKQFLMPVLSYSIALSLSFALSANSFKIINISATAFIPSSFHSPTNFCTNRSGCQATFCCFSH